MPAVSISMYTVNVEGVSNEVSLHINPGELVAILGSKSNRNELLKTIAGRNFEADSGQIMLQGLERSKQERV